MTRLSRLLGALGPEELARRLGRSPSTVRRWSKSGKVPEAARDDLRAVERRRHASKQAARVRQEREEAKRREADRRKRAREEKSRAEESRRRADAKKRAAEETRAEASRRALAEKKALDQQRELEEKARRDREAKARALAEAREKAFELARRAKAEQARKALDAKKKQKEADAEETRIRRGELAEAIRLLDNVRGIAEAIGVDEVTVRRWMEKPPLKSEAYDRLRRLIGSLHILLELMKQAGQIGKLPKVSTANGVRSGRRTDGVYWTKRFMGFLDPVTISDIGRWIRSHGGNYPFWQVAVVTSQYALHSGVDFSDAGPKNTTRDYKTIIVQISEKKWGDFAAERIEPSSETRSPSAAAADIEARLKARSQSGLVQVFVHGVTLFAYRRRTPEEEKQWATKERRKRQESWDKRQKAKKARERRRLRKFR